MLFNKKPVQVKRNGNSYHFIYRKEGIWGVIWSYLFLPALIFIIYKSYQSAANSFIHITPQEKLSAGFFYFFIYTLILLVIVFGGGIFFGSGKGSFTLDENGITIGTNNVPYSHFQTLYRKLPSGRMERSATHSGISFTIAVDGQITTSPYIVSNFFNASDSINNESNLTRRLNDKRYQIRLATTSGDIKVAGNIRLGTSTDILNAVMQIFQGNSTGHAHLPKNIPGMGIPQ